jgi:hypothetical protein
MENMECTATIRAGNGFKRNPTQTGINKLRLGK